MRLAALLLLALPAAAAPHLRWIDTKGDIHTDRIVEVLQESGGQVEVKLEDGGGARTVPLERVLDLVRERDDREEERALLEARADVALNLRLAEARPVLDRLAEKGSAPWVREYAAAARAVLAQRAGEKDAAARIERFLKDHPGSRFTAAVIRAEGRMCEPTEDATKVVEHVKETAARIQEAQGPLLDRYGTILDGAERLGDSPATDFNIFVESSDRLMSSLMDPAQDYGAYVVLQSAGAWAKLTWYEAQARTLAGLGSKPWTQMARVRELADVSSLLLPELRSDLRRTLAAMLEACGRRDEAREEVARAVELAPDPGRRRAAEALAATLAGK